MIHEDDQEEEMQSLVAEVQRVSERIDTMMIEIAREREALNWSEMLLLLDDVVNHPRDIALAVKLARVVGTIESIFQLHQQLMNTMTESTGILLRLLQDAMSGEHAEPFLPRIHFLDGIRRVAENIDRMLAEVAHRQEAFHWEQLLLIVGELKHNPQDIERAMQLARAAPGLQGIFQLHQNVFTTAAESHALLRALVSDEEKPSAPQQAPILPVSPHSTSSRMSSRLSIQTGRQTSSAQRVYRPSLAVRLLEGWVYGFLFAMMGFLIVVLLLVPMRGLSQVQQLATRGGFALVFLILAGVMAMIVNACVNLRRNNFDPLLIFFPMLTNYRVLSSVGSATRADQRSITPPCSRPSPPGHPVVDGSCRDERTRDTPQSLPRSLVSSAKPTTGVQVVRPAAPRPQLAHSGCPQSRALPHQRPHRCCLSQRQHPLRQLTFAPLPLL